MHFQNINTRCPNASVYSHTQWKCSMEKKCVYLVLFADTRFCFVLFRFVTLEFQKKRCERETECNACARDPLRNHAPLYNSRQCSNEITVSHYSIAALIAGQRHTILVNKQLKQFQTFDANGRTCNFL